MDKNNSKKIVYNLLFKFANIYLNESISHNNRFNSDKLGGISCTCNKNCSRLAIRTLIREEFIWTKFLWINIFNLLKNETKMDQCIKNYIDTMTKDNLKILKNNIMDIIKGCTEIIDRITNMYPFVSFLDENEIIKKIPLNTNNIKLRKLLDLPEKPFLDHPKYIVSTRNKITKKNNRFVFNNISGYKMITDKKVKGYNNKVYSRIFNHPDKFYNKI